MAISEDSRRRASIAEAGKPFIVGTEGSSAPSVQNEAILTDTALPIDDPKSSNTSSLSRHATRTMASRPISMITSRLSRDKLASPDPINNDQAETSNCEAPRKGSNLETTKPKVKEKRHKLRSKAFHGDNAKGPDRECIVM